jgi:hypothetical protein
MSKQTRKDQPDRRLEWLKVLATLADAATRILDYLRH